jgi:hypothetical protein
MTEPKYRVGDRIEWMRVDPDWHTIGQGIVVRVIRRRLWFFPRQPLYEIARDIGPNIFLEERWLDLVVNSQASVPLS